MAFIRHYGVKGMHWGVRRYQNKDGTRTEAGKKHYSDTNRARRRIIENRKTMADANDIVNTLTPKEKRLLGAPQHEDWMYEENAPGLAKRIVQKYGDIPISFIEVWDNDDGSGTAEIAIATRNDPRFRGKGYASLSVGQMLEWYNKYGHRTIKELYWSPARENKASIALAKKHGFKEATKDEYYKKYSSGWDKYTTLKYGRG